MPRLRAPSAAAAFAAAALLLASAGIAAAPHASAQQMPPSPVRVDAVRKAKLREQRRVTGNVRAHERSTVATREPGLVVESPLREGDRVEKGAVLARLDARRLELDLAVLEAEKKAAETVVAERADDAERARRDLESLRGLTERGAANPRELRDAETAASMSESRVRNAQTLVTVLDARVAVMRDRIDDMTVKAPFAGRVVARHADVGEWLGEGAGVVELVSDALEVWLDVPQRDFAYVVQSSAGARVVSDATGRALDVPGVRVVRDVDPRSRTFPVVAPLPGDAGLAPGMSVTAWVPTADEGEHLTVDEDAVLRGETGAYVYVAAPGATKEAPSTAVPVPVEILFVQGDRAVVRAERLAEGAMAIVEGNERLFPGAPVAPAPQSPAPTAAPAAPDGGRR